MINPKSLGLVAIQFVLITLLLTPVRGLAGTTPHQVTGLILILLACILALWAGTSMRFSNFSVFPEPVSEGSLIEHGPYRFVRHPMYSALIIAGTGAAVSHGTVLKFVFIICLILVLVAKIRREESLLSQRYLGYAAYSKKTHALIPGVY